MSEILTHSTDTNAQAVPVGHQGARIEIKESTAWSLSSGTAALLLLLLTIGLLGSIAAAIPVIASNLSAGVKTTILVLLTMAFAVFFMALSGFTMINPGHTKVVQFLGRYIGTVRRTGFTYVMPLSSKRTVSARVRNFETNDTKVNDYNGNPIHIAAIVVWQITDTAKAVFAVEYYKDFVKTQAEAALRHIATQHPYDESGANTELPSLRGSTNFVSDKLAAELAERVAIAGIEILETRISSLSYAPEIAQSMLQRQQAAAIVDARETIVEGAVGMVQQALVELEARGVVTLDPERRAAMVSNLLVVLCSDSNATPVINSGSLYN